MVRIKLSFLPGDLHLNKEQNGGFVITVQGEEVRHTNQEKKALMKFNALRREMEAPFPPHEVSLGDKRAILQKWITESRVGLRYNSLRTPKKKISTTRTFGWLKKIPTILERSQITADPDKLTINTR